MIDIARAKNAFKDFLEEYKDKSDLGFELKIVHTYYVAENAKKIAQELNLSKEDIELAELIGVEAANNASIEVAVIYDKYSDCNREVINKLSQYQFKDYNEMLNYIKYEKKDKVYGREFDNNTTRRIIQNN